MTDTALSIQQIANAIPGARMVAGVPILPAQVQAPSTQGQMFGNQIPSKSGVLHEFHTNSLVTPEVAIECRLCAKIINKNTGFEWNRDLSPNGHWDVLYGRALKYPDEFEVVMEAESRRVVEVDGDYGAEHRPVFSVSDLKALAKGKLDEIGRVYGVASSRKQDLIVKIVNAQAELLAQVRADKISDRLVAPIKGESVHLEDTQLSLAAQAVESEIDSQVVEPITKPTPPPAVPKPFPGRK